jgi:hypothetical protein
MNKKIATLFSACMFVVCSMQAQTTGGPDAYGYIWRDSNDPSGPVYNWLDVPTMPGAQQVRFLADDNTIGSFPIGFTFHYYWYDVTQFWVGSNGYLGFTNGQISAPFPGIPMSTGTQDFLAAMGTDLIFDPGNSAECWRYTNAAHDTLVLSWINVPFYDATIPTGSGNNSFQIILSGVDSSITFQYKDQVGTYTAGSGITIGIENNSGTIGLPHSYGVLPPTAYAVKYIYPGSSSYVVNDASTIYNENTETGGVFLSQNGLPFTMITTVKNTGNQNLPGYNVYSRVLNSTGTIIVSDNKTSSPSVPAQVETITMTNQFTPAVAGTYRYASQTQLSGDATPSNDQKIQEVVVVDTTAASIRLSYDNNVEAGAGGLNWTGGSGGAAIYYVPPFYPCKLTDIYEYIVANPLSNGFSMLVYDDNGPAGSAGTQLDSVYINPSSVMTAAWNTQTLATPLVINSGGVYVAWKMNGDGLTLGQNQVGPFSYREFEILGSAWSQYRYRETEDLMINIGISKMPPVSGAGVQESVLDEMFGEFYPNPASEMALINFSFPFSVKSILYQLYDVQGRLVSQVQNDNNTSDGKLVVAAHELTPGIYTCRIIVDGNEVVRRLAVAK